MNEEWKPVIIDKKESGYMISNYGNIKNKSDKILSPYIINSGYRCINISVSAKRYHLLIHRLVAEAFIPNPNNLPQVNHKDGNKDNNHYTNLEWMTQSENMKHAVDNGLRIYRLGEESPFAKHNNEQIEKACELLNTGKYSINEISSLTGVSYKTIVMIRHGTKWKSISSKYDVKKPLPNRNSWSDDQNKTVIDLYKNGMNYRDISKKLGVDYNHNTISHISYQVCKYKASTTNPEWCKAIS